MFKNIIAGAVSGALVAIIIGFSFLTAAPGMKGGEGGFEEQVQTQVVGSQEDLVVKAVEKASPAVVSIIISKDVPVLERYFDQSPFSFNIPMYRDSGQTQKKEVGGGSGFLVSDDGYVVTNKHVVSDETADYTVFLSDQTKFEAKVVARDPLNDIAVLKIESDKKLPYLEFGDSDKLKPGQTVIAIGNPLLEFENSVSVGVVSGLARSITASDRGVGQSERLDGVIQTDAAINPGNSGGPLLNLQGMVVGMNVAVGSGENLGFSLPDNIVKSVVESVKKNGKIVRPYLGIRYVQVTDALKEANKLTVDYGVLVSRGDKSEDLAVFPGSPADKAGLEENDIILELDGQKLDDKHSLAGIVATKNAGDELSLKVLHKGKEETIKVKLEEIPQ